MEAYDTKHLNTAQSFVSTPYLLNILLKFHFILKTSTCERCHRFEKLKMQAPNLKTIKVKKPLEEVGMDLIGKLNYNISFLTFFCTLNFVCSDIF